jgi:hypothetical protein
VPKWRRWRSWRSAPRTSASTGSLAVNLLTPMTVACAVSARSRACVQAAEMLVVEERKRGLTAELLDPLRSGLVWRGRPPRLAEVRGLSRSEILLGRRYRLRDAQEAVRLTSQTHTRPPASRGGSYPAPRRAPRPPTPPSSRGR